MDVSFLVVFSVWGCGKCLKNVRICIIWWGGMCFDGWRRDVFSENVRGM